MMMFGFGSLMMLLVMGLPILLIVLLFVGGAALFQRVNRANPDQPITRAIYTPAPQPTSPIETFARYCSHCGAGLHSDWTHCPQCGAPVP